MSTATLTAQSPSSTARAQVARIFAWRRGFNAMHLIDLGVRLGLFKALADAPQATARKLAARLGLHEPDVRVRCTTAYGFGPLGADAEEQLRLAPHIDAIPAQPARRR